jgi:ribonuclease HII
MPHDRHEQTHGGRVAGVDEVGRGPLAGPVLAAAVVFPTGVSQSLGAMLDDSKRLSILQREAAYAALRNSDADIAVGAASVMEIARLNVLHASLLAMSRAIARLSFPPDLVLVDGNRPPPVMQPVQCIVGGDSESFSIAAASIIAKVVRDRLMARLARRYPAYGWERNAGYGTAAHRQALLALGPTLHHRAEFGTVRRLRLHFAQSGVDAVTAKTSA